MSDRLIQPQKRQHWPFSQAARDLELMSKASARLQKHHFCPAQRPLALTCACGECQPIAPLYSCPNGLISDRRPALVLPGHSKLKRNSFACYPTDIREEQKQPLSPFPAKGAYCLPIYILCMAASRTRPYVRSYVRLYTGPMPSPAHGSVSGYSSSSESFLTTVTLTVWPSDSSAT